MNTPKFQSEEDKDLFSFVSQAHKRMKRLNGLLNRLSMFDLGIQMNDFLHK